MKVKLFMPILLSIFLLGSCIPKQELENLGVINARGVVVLILEKTINTKQQS